MKRSEILEAARRCVCGEREQDYGTPENNFETIGLLWGVYLRAAHPEFAKVMPINGITAKDAGTMLALLKVARIATGSSPDSFIDLAGYAACECTVCMEEMAELTKELSKNLRGQDNAAHIAEEIADVEIMLEQLKLMFSIRDEVTQQRTVKLQRLDNRISQSLIHPKP